ncbi:MAG: ABC transporter permease, partial [Actinobacteria bacterium]
MRQRLRELWDYREVLLNLVRKELKVKYIGSVLGAVWSLLNPVVFLAVFT